MTKTSNFDSFVQYYNLLTAQNEFFLDIQPSIPDLTEELFIPDFNLMLKLLRDKFGYWSMRYFIAPINTEIPSLYSIREFKRIFRDSFINFYWVNKKNTIANLDTFGEMSNWGSKEIFQMKQFVVENYIPLSSDEAVPHSETPMTSDTNNQYIDFLKYYNSLAGTNNKFYDNFYSEFLPLFKLIYN